MKRVHTFILPRFSEITFTQIVISVILGIVFLIYLNVKEQLEDASAPTTSWIEIRKLEIPNHKIGSEYEVPIVYDRVVKQPFVGKWFAETQLVTDDGLQAIRLCRSVSYINYDPVKGNSTPTLGWLLNLDRDGQSENCTWVDEGNKQFKPGQYRTCVVHEIVFDSGLHRFSQPVCSNFYTKFVDEFSNAPAGILGYFPETPRAYSCLSRYTAFSETSKEFTC